MARTEIERLGLGRLERLDLKSFWGEQLPDLTPWFLQNIDLLSETLGIDITPLEREVNVDTGSFNVLGADATGRPIVIENRLEATDHNQLGQMIVHASGLDAAVVRGGPATGEEVSGASWAGGSRDGGGSCWPPDPPEDHPDGPPDPPD